MNHETDVFLVGTSGAWSGGTRVQVVEDRGEEVEVLPWCSDHSIVVGPADLVRRRRRGQEGAIEWEQV